MKKLFSIIAMLLAVAMMTLTATPAFAATKSKVYISDVAIVSADSYDDAKAKLENNDYQILDGELNPDLNKQIYIGYRTTYNADEAITDMAVMNMRGPFSYSSYKQIIEKQRSTVDAHMTRLIPSIVRYQESCDAGRQAAQLLREALNCYKEDLFHETPVLMGDYLYSYAGDSKVREELTDIFMRGGTEAMLAIEALLAMASESTENTLADRLATIAEDEMDEHYLEEYGTASAAHRGMKSELGDAANYIYNSFSGFREYLINVEKDYIVESADGADINNKALDSCDYKSEYYKDLPEDYNDYLNASGEVMEAMTKQLLISDVAVYAMLKSIPYDEGSLYDFFMQDDDDIELSDMYPIVYCMNDAQRALLGNIGIKQLLLYTLTDVDNADSATVNAMRDYIDTFGGNPVSVYDGVDLSVFEDGVAFTDATVEHDRLTNDCWLASVLGGETEFDTMMRSSLIATCLTLGLGTIAAVSKMINARIVMENADQLEKLTKLKESADLQWNICNAELGLKYDVLYNNVKFVPNQQFLDSLEKTNTTHKALLESRNKITKEFEAAKAKAAAGSYAAVIKNVSLILTLITFAYDVYSIVHMLCTFLPEEEPVPHHIVTTVPTKYGDSYVYYAAASNVDGGYADINNHENAAVGWLALYTTRDAYAGDPILVDDLSVNTGSSYIAPGMSALHMFNEEAACNINDKTYSGSDKNGVYVIFKRDASYYSASVFSRNAVAAVGVGGLLLGAALGVLTTALVKRKKKDGDEAVSEAE